MKMRKRQCIHCFTESNVITRDHVFPSSWYTDNTPENVQRWTVPSCPTCNNVYAEKEINLLVRIVPCIDPQKPGVSGLHKKVFEAFGIGLEGKIDSEEFKKRKALAVKVFRELQPYSPNMRYFPNFGPHLGFPAETQHAVKIPANLIYPVLEKVFRGAEYKLGNRRLIKPPFKLRVYHIEKEIPELELLINKFGKKEYLGPGFKLERIVSQGEEVIYKATIWGAWVAYGSISTGSE